jgi:murein DD-endopeptidase MepM/ murein hydrolase activator NlpD
VRYRLLGIALLPAAVLLTTCPARAALRTASLDRTANMTTVTKVSQPIGAGDSFAGILGRYGLSAAEIQRWYRAAQPKLDLRRIAAGSSLALMFSPRGRLERIAYDVDAEHRLVLRRSGGDELVAHLARRPVQIRVVGARGIIDQTFYGSARREGIPDAVISEMADVLGYRLDFSSDVRLGDRFRVLYEERTGEDGRLLKPGRVLAADFMGRSQSAAAFLYEDANGETTYVDEEGHALDRALLRYPVEFTRITSTFSKSRFHPILKKRRPHLGVDFAAPAGTPVRSIGAGVVTWAAWKGGLGRHVEVDHGGGLVSAYSHLKGIDRAIHTGAKVKRGQRLGWVGQSGLATGPHLHFAIFENGHYTNPLKMKRTVQLAQIDPERFEHLRTAMTERLRALPGDYRSASSTPPIVLSALAQARRLGPVILTL